MADANEPTPDALADDEIVEGWRNGHPGSDADPLAHRIILEVRDIVRDTPDAYDYFVKADEAHEAIQAAKRRDLMGNILAALLVLALCGYSASFVLSFVSLPAAVVTLAVSGIASIVAQRLVWKLLAVRW